jgi:hypothetical protein
VKKKERVASAKERAARARRVNKVERRKQRKAREKDLGRRD